jgi:hypothetical protein
LKGPWLTTERPREKNKRAVDGFYVVLLFL